MCAGRHVVGVAPRIGTGLDRQKPVLAALVGHGLSDPVEIRVERCVVLVDRVAIAAGGVALPQLD